LRPWLPLRKTFDLGSESSEGMTQAKPLHMKQFTEMASQVVATELLPFLLAAIFCDNLAGREIEAFELEVSSFYNHCRALG